MYHKPLEVPMEQCNKVQSKIVKMKIGDHLPPNVFEVIRFIGVFFLQ